LRTALDMIASGFFSMGEPRRFKPIVDSLLQGGDKYMLLADYASYIACQEKVAIAYQNQDEWIRKAILNIANMGKFSSDHTIMQYASKIWDAKQVIPVK
jgi:starch phosphorylase